MSRYSHVVRALFIGSLLAAGAMPARGAYITFDQRENLNLLNSPDVTITANFYQSENNDSGNSPRGGFGFDTSSSGVGWFSGGTGGADEVFTIDLGAVRNVETFRLSGPRNIQTAIIETSPDGTPGSWTTVTQTGSSFAANNSTFILSTPANTRWLRLTGDTYEEPSPTVGLYTMRVYGSAGSVTADPGLDLVSSSAWAAGGVAITQSGGSITPATTLVDMANDNPAVFGRQLIYDLGTNDSVTVEFAQTIDSIGRVGFVIDNSGTYDPNVHFQMLGSTDGSDFNTVLVDQTGGLVVGPNWFNLATPFAGTHVRFFIVSATGADNRISDMFVHQAVEVPEPASLTVLALVALLAMRRRQV